MTTIPHPLQILPVVRLTPADCDVDSPPQEEAKRIAEATEEANEYWCARPRTYYERLRIPGMGWMVTVTTRFSDGGQIATGFVPDPEGRWATEEMAVAARIESRHRGGAK